MGSEWGQVELLNAQSWRYSLAQREAMTTANEVDEKNPTPYVFVSGDAEQEHQDEINRFASKGYRVIGMSQNSASVSYGKSVVVLMGFGSYAPH